MDESKNSKIEKRNLVILIVIIALIFVGFIITLSSQTDKVNKIDQREGKSEKNFPTSNSDSLDKNDVTSGRVSVEEDYEVEIHKDIVYGSASNLSLKIDIYEPKELNSPAPAVLFIHGGGFHGGSKNGTADEAEMLAKHGVVVAAVDYRLSGTAIFPAPLHDVKGAVRFLKAHASEYNIDPDSIFSLGESAGGVLASLLAVTGGDTSLEGTIGGNNSYTSEVAGAVNISGSYVASIVETMSAGILRAIENETGCAPVPSTSCESTYEALSAETYISSNDSPFIILHGDKDQAVPQVQAETLNSKLNDTGIPSELHIGLGFGHVAGLLSHFMNEVVSFLNENS